MDGTLKTTKLGEGIWTFNEAVENTGPQVDAYLLVGTDRALVIDTLMEERSLYTAVRELTDLPVDVVITHAHGDHAGKATEDFKDAGCDVYIDIEGEDALIESSGMDAAWFKPLEERQIFDLGGCRLEILDVSGHTPGSIALLDKERQLLFTGDAIGSGAFWMQIPYALPLRQLLESLERLRKAVAGMKNLNIHPGHRHQAPVQLTGEFLDDVTLMTRKLISGEWSGEDREMTLRGKKISYKTLSYKFMTDYCYNPDNL